MTHIPDIEPILDSWLAEGTDVLPDRSVEAVLHTVGRTSQRSAWRVPWRTDPMNGNSRMAMVAGAAIVVVLVVGGLVYLGGSRGPSVGGGGGTAPTPTATVAPSPTPAATADPLDTSTWNTFDSARYGLSIAYPADWSATPGKSDWDITTDAEAWISEAPDKFCSPDTGSGVVCVSAWSASVAPGTTVEAWIEMWCATTRPDAPSSCSGIADRAVAVETKDQHPGLGFFVSDFDTMAFFLDGDTIYIVGAWREETGPIRVAVRRRSGAPRGLYLDADARRTRRVTRAIAIDQARRAHESRPSVRERLRPALGQLPGLAGGVASHEE